MLSVMTSTARVTTLIGGLIYAIGMVIASVFYAVSMAVAGTAYVAGVAAFTGTWLLIAWIAYGGFAAIVGG